MQTKKHFLQKVSGVIAIMSFVSCAICLFLLISASDNATDVYKASFAASTFFFFMVGMVLKLMATTNLPSIKLDNTSNK